MSRARCVYWLFGLNIRKSEQRIGMGYMLCWRVVFCFFSMDPKIELDLYVHL